MMMRKGWAPFIFFALGFGVIAASGFQLTLDSGDPNHPGGQYVPIVVTDTTDSGGTTGFHHHDRPDTPYHNPVSQNAGGGPPGHATRKDPAESEIKVGKPYTFHVKWTPPTSQITDIN